MQTQAWDLPKTAYKSSPHSQITRFPRTTSTLHIRLSLTRTYNMVDVKILAAILSVVAYYAFKLLSLGHRRAEMPPGPPTKPVIGNVHLMGSSGLFKVFQKWRVSTGSETDMAFDADFLPG